METLLLQLYQEVGNGNLLFLPSSPADKLPLLCIDSNPLPDRDHHTVTFCPLEAAPTFPPGSYRLQLSPGAESRLVHTVTVHMKTDMFAYVDRVALCMWTSPAPPTSAINGVTTPTLEWLKTVLLRKVSQWSEETASHAPSQRGKSLVPLSRYSQLYRELKHKHGEPLVKVGCTSGIGRCFIVGGLTIVGVSIRGYGSGGILPQEISNF